MNLPFPDVNSMSSDQVIRWMTISLLVFVLGFLYGELQARMREHQQLLLVGQVQCFNEAERVVERPIRAKQMHRCLTLKLDADPQD